MLAIAISFAALVYLTAAGATFALARKLDEDRPEGPDRDTWLAAAVLWPLAWVIALAVLVARRGVKSADWVLDRVCRPALPPARAREVRRG